MTTISAMSSSAFAARLIKRKFLPNSLFLMERGRLLNSDVQNKSFLFITVCRSDSSYEDSLKKIFKLVCAYEPLDQIFVELLPEKFTQRIFVSLPISPLPDYIILAGLLKCVLLSLSCDFSLLRF